MAPQTTIPIAADVLSTIGTVFWCVQLAPQVWYNWRRKKTEGLPGSMMFIWATSAVPFGVYAIIQNFAIPIQIQPQIFGTLALVNWGQTLLYQNSWKKWTASAIVILFAVIFGGIELALVLTLRPVYDKGVAWPVILIGVVAAVLLVLGFLPPYLEIWTRRGQVVGISWIFLTIDCLGALFSVFALVAQRSFDALGATLYIVVLVLEVGILLSQGIWLLRTRRTEKQVELAIPPINNDAEAL